MFPDGELRAVNSVTVIVSRARSSSEPGYAVAVPARSIAATGGAAPRAAKTAWRFMRSRYGQTVGCRAIYANSPCVKTADRPSTPA